MLLSISALVISAQSIGSEQKEILVGEYLGQKKPGNTPAVFAPGYVSGKHRDVNAFFSPDMTEFYFTRMDLKQETWDLISYTLHNGQWRESVVGPRVGRPLLAPDGHTMHLGQYYMTRNHCGWSHLKRLDPPFSRRDWGIMRLSASKSGTYILDDYKSGDIIRISEVKNGKRHAPIALGPEINTGKYNAHPFIAPDDSYIIWDGVRETGFGDSDLYISFRKPDGTWSEALNMGDTINTEVREASASVTPDGKYLFFNRATKNNDSDIYWVDAQIISTLKKRAKM
ncbi:PD40 domain-containing protein [Pseudoalteromonas luteoviolacea]|nr:PD40 domain-containing protein [Pseudoalteromonas luteoviolacea]